MPSCEALHSDGCFISFLPHPTPTTWAGVGASESGRAPPASTSHPALLNATAILSCACRAKKAIALATQKEAEANGDEDAAAAAAAILEEIEEQPLKRSSVQVRSCWAGWAARARAQPTVRSSPSAQEPGPSAVPHLSPQTSSSHLPHPLPPHPFHRTRRSWPCA
jgi:hypothetical protein